MPIFTTENKEDNIKREFACMEYDYDMYMKLAQNNISWPVVLFEGLFRLFLSHSIGLFHGVNFAGDVSKNILYIQQSVRKTGFPQMCVRSDLRA
jgi:hypothetical protein